MFSKHSLVGLILGLFLCGVGQAQPQPTNYTGLQWDSGVDAAKPTYCRAPGSYYATDTLRRYDCDSNGHLTLITAAGASSTFVVDACATAVCNGVADDHVAVLAALATIPNTGGTLLFSKPTVNMGTTSLTIPYTQGNVCIGSYGMTALKYSGSGRAVSFGDSTHMFQRAPCMFNMTINISTATSAATGLYLGIAWYGSFTNVYILTGTGSSVGPNGQTGMLMDGGTTFPTTFSVFNIFTNLNIVGDFTYGVVVGSGIGQGQINSTIWVGGSVVSTTVGPGAKGTIGMWIRSGDSNSTSKLDVENWVDGVQIESSANGPLNIRPEGNTVAVLGTSNCDTNDLGSIGFSTSSNTVVDQCGTGLHWTSMANGGLVEDRNPSTILRGYLYSNLYWHCTAQADNWRQVAVYDSTSATPGTTVSSGGGTNQVILECVSTDSGSTFHWMVM